MTQNERPDFDFNSLLTGRSPVADRVDRNATPRRQVIDPISLAVGPLTGVAVGLLGWNWLGYLPTGLLLFAVVPLLASVAASDRVMPRVILLTNLAMLAAFFCEELRQAAVAGYFGRAVQALPITIPVYAVIAGVGSFVALLVNALGREALQRMRA